MTAPRPTRVVIAGGGTAGWIAAVALARQLGRLVEVTLVESEEIGTIGVGESTIPTARAFHELLRIDQQAFMQASQASFKLGISFEGWARPGDRYIHSFGTAPLRTWVAEFQHFWLEASARGEAAPIGEYYPEHEAALAHRFTLQGEPALNYAYHLDAGLYARFLRGIAETDGVTRREGKIAEVELDGESGDVAALVHGGRRPDRGRPVRRLHRVSRAADRAHAGNGLRGLGALAADQRRLGGAERVGRRGAPLHARDRPPERLALAHPAAASHGQRAGVLDRAYRARGRARRVSRARSRASCCAIRSWCASAPAAGGRRGCATAWRSGCRRASSSRSNRPRST